MRRFVIAIAIVGASGFAASAFSGSPSARMGSLLVAGVLAAGAMVLWRGRSQTAVRPDRVECANQLITHLRYDGIVETIGWNDLHGIDVVTTSDGPWSEDVFMLLFGDNDDLRCTIPQGSEGFQSLVERVITLPDFDKQAFIAAMGSTSERTFTCWRRVAAA